MAPRHLLPKHPAWLLTTIVTGVVALTVYVIVSWRGTWSPGRLGGLIFGGMAAGLVFITALYPLRRRLRLWPLTTGERWLQLHVYAGVLIPLFAALHVGLQLPAGRLGIFIVLTGAWSVASGLIGVILQKQLPAMLAAGVSVEATYEHIPQLAERLHHQADQLMAGSPAMIANLYQQDIRPALVSLQPSWYYLLDTGSVARGRLAPLRGVHAYVDDANRERLEDLETIVTEKHQLDVQYSLQRALRQWLLLHVPVTYLFVGLLVLHIMLVVSF